MDIRKLQRAIVDGLEDVKAQNIVVFNTEHLSPLFERVIIASGTSNRQTKALAASVRETRQVARPAGAAHRGRGQRRVDHRRLRRRRGAHHAAGDPRLLPPRGDLGRQAGAA
ncbi:MAG: RsfS/YbeB/iojap family protein [Comamonadaceae bacterium]|nr:RsfS/YbeB/iojap family protein [Comamonadaceae bacterium]